MLQGALDFLLQPQCKEAQSLREQFIFKIVPMLNPDGVVRGNYRCNTLGIDLNRRWQNPSKLLHPTVYFTKYLAKQLTSNNLQIAMFCDMHGHSRKRNVFMYGCVSGQSELLMHRNNNLIKLVPYMLSQRNKSFSFADCKFANEREKESTARMVMFREFSILNSYTLESTFYAMQSKEAFKRRKEVESDLQIRAEDLLQIGGDLCLTIAHILQSKILRKKFLYQQDFGGISLAEAAKHALLQVSSSVNGAKEGSLMAKEQPVIPLKDVIGDPKTKNAQGNEGECSPIQPEQMNGRKFIFKNSGMVKHLNSMPTAYQEQSTTTSTLFNPSTNLTLKKKSSRALTKEMQTHNITNVINGLVAPESQAFSPEKKMSSFRINSHLQGLQAVVQQGSSPVVPKQLNQMNPNLNTRLISLQQPILKLAVLEPPPNQVNAILVNQFVHLSRGNKAEILKFHNQNQIKGLVITKNTNFMNTGNQPGVGVITNLVGPQVQQLSLSPDRRKDITAIGTNLKLPKKAETQQKKSNTQTTAPLSQLLFGGTQNNFTNTSLPDTDSVESLPQIHIKSNGPPRLRASKLKSQTANLRVDAKFPLNVVAVKGDIGSDLHSTETYNSPYLKMQAASNTKVFFNQDITSNGDTQDFYSSGHKTQMKNSAIQMAIEQSLVVQSNIAKGTQDGEGWHLTEQMSNEKELMELIKMSRQVKNNVYEQQDQATSSKQMNQQGYHSCPRAQTYHQIRQSTQTASKKMEKGSLPNMANTSNEGIQGSQIVGQNWQTQRAQWNHQPWTQDHSNQVSSHGPPKNAASGNKAFNFTSPMQSNFSGEVNLSSMTPFSFSETKQHPQQQPQPCNNPKARYV